MLAPSRSSKAQWGAQRVVLTAALFVTDAYVSEDELGIAKLLLLGSRLLRLDRYANTPEEDWGDSVLSFPVALKALPKHVHLYFYVFYTL